MEMKIFPLKKKMEGEKAGRMREGKEREKESGKEGQVNSSGVGQSPTAWEAHNRYVIKGEKDGRSRRKNTLKRCMSHFERELKEDQK